MKILDKEIDIDLGDVDTIMKFKEEYTKTDEAINKLQGQDIITLKEYCNIVRNFFINIFGNDDMLPKTNNYMKLTQAYVDFTNEFGNVITEFLNNLDEQTKKMQNNYSLDRLQK